MLVKPLLQKFFFTDHLNHKVVNKTTCRTPLANPFQLWAHYLKSVRSVAIIFLRLSEFPDLSSKVFLITFNPICPGVFLSDHAAGLGEGGGGTQNAFDMKFGTVILKKIMRKMVKNVFFSKISLVTARKNIFKIFFQLLKVETT